MARKLEFNYDQAIARATNLFWANGYSNTSLLDLLKTMGIGQGSFYNLLESKKNLYLQCLKQYNDTVTKRRLDALDSEKSVKKGLRKFFKTILDELSDPKTPRICLMASSLSADVLEVPEFRDYVIGEFKLFEKHITKRLTEAVKLEELPKNFKIELTAETIVTYLQGFFRVVRTLKKRHQMQRQIEALLIGLGL